MKSAQKILIILLGLFIFNGLYAQSIIEKTKLETDSVRMRILNKRAEKHHKGLAYIKAIEKYEKLVDMGFAPDSVKRNLAVSYFKVGETVKSEEIFADLVETADDNPTDMYYYAQSLKYNKKYDEADVWIDKYKLLIEKDRRADLQHQAAPVIKEIYSKEKFDVSPVWFNSKYSDFGAVVYGNDVYFASGRNDQAIVQYEYSWKGTPYLDIYRTQKNASDIIANPKIVSKGLNSRFHDGPLAYNSEQNEVFVTRSNFNHGLPKYGETKENHFKLYQARMDGESWSDMEELPFNSNNYSCGHPSVAPNNKRLYFASDMPGGFGESDIYYVERLDSGWSAPVNLGPEINTEGDEMFPYAGAEDDLYFASNGHLGLGGLDIFLAQKNSKGKYLVFNMGFPLNTNADDFSFYLEDDVNGYFASNREGGKGDDDIYKFAFLEKPNSKLELTGIVKDINTGEILSNAKVALVNTKNEVIYEGSTDVNGKFVTEVNRGESLTLKANKERYQKDSKQFDVETEDGTTAWVEIELDLIYEWGVFGLIYEKESGDGVSNVGVIITPKDGSNEIITMTNNEGNFRELLKKETDYDILLKKKKFFTRRGEFTTKNMAPGWIDVKEFIEVEMEEIVVGKTIEIPNIYYDLAKWNIREDAAFELDKVVQFLLDNETITIELGSHTDSRGSNSSNQTLSQKRAESAVAYIVNSGIAQSRISAKGYGEERLKNHCSNGVQCSKEEHQANRRTEIMIVDF